MASSSISPLTGLNLAGVFGALALDNGRKRRVKKARKKAARRAVRAQRKAARQERREDKRAIRQQGKAVKKAARKGTAPPPPLRRPLAAGAGRKAVSPRMRAMQKARQMTGGRLSPTAAAAAAVEADYSAQQPWTEQAALSAEQGPSSVPEFQPSSSSSGYWDGGGSSGDGGGGMESYPMMQAASGELPSTDEAAEEELEEEGTSPWLIGGAVLLLAGGIGYYVYRKRKTQSGATSRADEDEFNA